MFDRSDGSGDDRAEGRDCDRRTVLRSGLAAAGFAVGGSGAAGAQETPTETRVTTKAVTLEQERYDDLTGMFLHVEGRPSPIEASVADACDYVDWRDEATNAYDVVLLDRTQADVPQSRTTLYLHERDEVPPGALWVVNNQQRCGGGYVGLRLEQIGATKLEVGLSGDVGTETPTERSGN